MEGGTDVFSIPTTNNAHLADSRTPGGLCLTPKGGGALDLTWSNCNCGIVPNGNNAYMFEPYRDGEWLGSTFVSYEALGADGYERLRLYPSATQAKLGETWHFRMAITAWNNPNDWHTTLPWITSNSVMVT